MSFWKSALGIAAAASLCACQVVSGLSDLEVRDSSGSGGSSASSAGSGGGGAGGGGGVEDPCSSGGCPIVFVENLKVRVDSLGIDNDYLYFASKGTVVQPNGSIWRVSLSGGGSPEQILASQRPHGLAASKKTSTLFWLDSALGVLSIKVLSPVMPNPPNAPQELYKASTISDDWRALTLNPINDQLFWAQTEAAAINAVNGPTPYFSDAGAPHVIAMDETNAYWFDGDSIDTALLAGMGRELVAYAEMTTYGVAVDDANVYWTVRWEGGSVQGCPKGVNQNATPIVQSQSFPKHVYTDGKSIYWSNDGALNCMNGSAGIYRVPAGLGGGYPELLGDGQKCPTNFVEHGDYVYWGSEMTIYRVKK